MWFLDITSSAPYGMMSYSTTQFSSNYTKILSITQDSCETYMGVLYYICGWLPVSIWNENSWIGRKKIPHRTNRIKIICLINICVIVGINRNDIGSIIIITIIVSIIIIVLSVIVLNIILIIITYNVQFILRLGSWTVGNIVICVFQGGISVVSGVISVDIKVLQLANYGRFLSE